MQQQQQPYGMPQQQQYGMPQQQQPYGMPQQQQYGIYAHVITHFFVYDYKCTSTAIQYMYEFCIFILAKSSLFLSTKHDLILILIFCLFQRYASTATTDALRIWAASATTTGTSKFL